MLSIASADPAAPDSMALLEALSATLQRITGSTGEASFNPDDLQAARACFVVARDRSGTSVGCGALRPLDASTAELKRMYASPGTKGVGSAVLDHLERQARDWGYAQVWLETRRVNERAVAFYERHGYRTIPNFGRYVGRSEAVCFGKTLTAP